MKVVVKLQLGEIQIFQGQQQTSLGPGFQRSVTEIPCFNYIVLAEGRNQCLP